jgi:hypothetical protein
MGAGGGGSLTVRSAQLNFLLPSLRLNLPVSVIPASKWVVLGTFSNETCINEVSSFSSCVPILVRLLLCSDFGTSTDFSWIWKGVEFLVKTGPVMGTFHEEPRSLHVPIFLRSLRCTYLLTSLLTYFLTYLLPYLLTPWSWVLLEKLNGLQLVKFPAFYGTRKFITAFTSARHLALSWARSTQSIPPTSHFLEIHLNIILPSTPG